MIQTTNEIINENQNETKETKQKMYTQAEVDNLINIQKSKQQDLTQKYDTLESEFRALKASIVDKERTDILINAGFDKQQLNNLKKLLSDVETDKLVDYINNDKTLDIFRKSNLNTQQPKETNKPTNNTESKPIENEVLRTLRELSK